MYIAIQTKIGNGSAVICDMLYRLRGRSWLRWQIWKRYRDMGIKKDLPLLVVGLDEGKGNVIIRKGIKTLFQYS
jgi:hypothetical protein